MLWLARGARPDLSFATNALARVAYDPGRTHWQLSSHMFRYLATHPDSRITYTHTGRPLFLYVDSDYLPDYGSTDSNRRSTTGYVARHDSAVGPHTRIPTRSQRVGHCACCGRQPPLF